MGLLVTNTSEFQGPNPKKQLCSLSAVQHCLSAISCCPGSMHSPCEWCCGCHGHWISSTSVYTDGSRRFSLVVAFSCCFVKQFLPLTFILIAFYNTDVKLQILWVSGQQFTKSSISLHSQPCLIFNKISKSMMVGCHL